MKKISALKLGLFLLASLGILASASILYPSGLFSILSALLAYLLAGLIVILAVRGFLAQARNVEAHKQSLSRTQE